MKYLLFCKLQFKDRKFDENCEDDVYRERHRIPREAVDYLEEKLHDQLSYQSRRNRPLTPRQQVWLLHKLLSKSVFLNRTPQLFSSNNFFDDKFSDDLFSDMSIGIQKFQLEIYPTWT